MKETLKENESLEKIFGKFASHDPNLGLQNTLLEV
jgi:hypothetical protein